MPVRRHRRADRAVRTLAALSVVLVAACGSGDGGSSPVALDGSARYPDDQGIATELSHEEITLDGKRTYKVSPKLAAFSTVTATLEPMLNRENQYVQVGLDGDTMVWMAGVAAVVKLPQGPRVFYNGTLRRVDGKGRLVFRDGTVWELAKGVDVPKAGERLQLEIDPARHRVVRILGG